VDDFLVLQAARLQHQNHGEGYYGNSGDQYADNHENNYDQHHQEEQPQIKHEENKNFENNHNENPFDLRPAAENISEPQSENPFDLKPAGNEPAAENPFDLKPANNESIVAQQPASTLPKPQEDQPGQAQSPQLQSEKNKSFGEGPLYVNRDENCEEYIRVEVIFLLLLKMTQRNSHQRKKEFLQLKHLKEF